MDHATVTTAIKRGVDYLVQHQYPNGEFCCYIAGDEPMLGWIVPESTLFATMVVATCLLPLQTEPAVDAMLTKATSFLHYHMYRGGVWPVFSNVHRWRWIVPYDTDSMAYASALMHARQINCLQPSNVPLLLANRNRQGLFYTWFVMRPRWQPNLTHWRLAVQELRRPFQSIAFWYANECSRNDVDMGINTNILYLLGDIPETQPIIAELLKLIAEQREADCDKWYRNPFTIYYLISRVYAKGITKLEPVRPQILARILATARLDGMLGKSVFDTALGTNALLNFGYQGPELSQAVVYLLNTQHSTGEWPRWLFYYGGPKLLQGWGSEELTTAFCLEALSHYQQTLATAAS